MNATQNAAAARLQTLARELEVGAYVEYAANLVTGRYLLDGRSIGDTAQEAQRWMRKNSRQVRSTQAPY